MYCYATLGQVRIVVSSVHTISSSAVTLSIIVHMIWNAYTSDIVWGLLYSIAEIILYTSNVDFVNYLFPLDKTEAFLLEMGKGVHTKSFLTRPILLRMLLSCFVFNI